MATLFVRVTGDDGFGDGSILAPYRTVGGAIANWNDGDVIDVGTGEFIETLSWDTTVDQGTIRGKGYKRTKIIASQVTDGLIKPSSVFNKRLLVQELTIEQRSFGMDILRVEDSDVTARWIFARCLLLLRDGYAANLRSSDAGIRADFLHCVIASADDNNQGKAFRGNNENTILARNTTFYTLALVVDDVEIGAEQDLNFNVYIDNTRLLRIGELGEQDVILTEAPYIDPPDDFTLQPNAVLRDAGLDLNDGYGEPVRLPPSELNWLFNGDYPDLAIEERLFPQGSSIASNYNIHLLLQVFAEEFARLQARHEQTRRNRFIETADAKALSARWGVWLDAIRPSNMGVNEYRDFIQEVLDLYLTVAPASRATNRAAQLLFDEFPQRIDYHNSRRFPLGTALKLYTVLPTPSLTVRLSPGEFQIKRRWYRVIQTDLVLPANETSLIYADGDTSPDDVLATIKQTTDLTLRNGFRPDALTGVLLFENGQTTVIGTSTSFTTELAPFDVIRPTGTNFLFQVESIQSDQVLTLRRSYSEPTLSSPSEVFTPLEVFGEVTTDGSTIIDIKSPGRLSQTAFLNSSATKGHGYEIIINDGGIESVFSDDERVALLTKMLCRSKPIHKLGFLSFEQDLPQGVILCKPSAPFSQSSIDYVETWEDSTWPAA